MATTWNEVLIAIVGGIVGLAFTVVSAVLVPMLVAWLKTKTENEVLKNAIDRAGEIITNAARATTQTYVDALKKSNTFDETAQKTAFKMTMDAVLELLNAETKQAIIDTYGDLEKWITTEIEAAVFTNKK